MNLTFDFSKVADDAPRVAPNAGSLADELRQRRDRDDDVASVSSQSSVWTARTTGQPVSAASTPRGEPGRVSAKAGASRHGSRPGRGQPRAPMAASASPPPMPTHPAAMQQQQQQPVWQQQAYVQQQQQQLPAYAPQPQYTTAMPAAAQPQAYTLVQHEGQVYMVPAVQQPVPQYYYVQQQCNGQTYLVAVPQPVTYQYYVQPQPQQ